MTSPFAARSRALIAMYGVLWGLSVGYLYLKHADWTFPLVSMAVFGLGLSGLGALLTRRTDPPPIPVSKPKVELAAVLSYLAVYAAAFLVYGMNAVRAALPPGPGQEVLVLAVKLVVHVGAPSVLLIALGARVAPLFAPGLGRRGVLPALLVLGLMIFALLAVVSPSLSQIEDTGASVPTLAWAAPAAFLWLAAEAGLCEEFLFRAVLQTRLAAVLKTEAGAVVIGSLIFALAHVPGLYLRGHPGDDGYSTDVIQVAAFTIASLSPLALMFGTLWARTRSLGLVVLLHAAVDTLPNLAGFIRTWT